MPHTYVIIATIILLMAICTYIVPAGEYQRVVDEATGRTVVDPDTFTYVEQNPVKPFELFMTIPDGLVDAASIVFFIFVIGGAFEVIAATGAIESGISRIALRFRDSGKWLIPIFLVIFAVFGATIGMAEECMLFVPLGVMLARAVGYDAIVGVAMIMLGAANGFTSGALNPFTVGVAQTLAELPMFSGLWYRLIIMVVVVIATALYIMRYAAKIKANPELSVVRDLEIAERGKVLDLDNLPELTTKHKLVLATLAAGILSIVFGVFNFGWYIQEISTAFLITGIFAGFFGGMGPSKVSEHFVAGAKSVVFGALLVGVSKAILLVMQNGLILDTVVHGLAQVVGRLPSSITAVGMYFVQCLINFLIPSGSGQAAATMPIMVPLADVTGVERQVAVLAFQLGDGFSNSIIPYTASCMGSLSVANVPWEKWAKWFIKLLGIWYAIGLIFIVIAQAIGYA